MPEPNFNTLTIEELKIKTTELRSKIKDYDGEYLIPKINFEVNKSHQIPAVITLDEDGNIWFRSPDKWAADKKEMEQFTQDLTNGRTPKIDPLEVQKEQVKNFVTIEELENKLIKAKNNLVTTSGDNNHYWINFEFYSNGSKEKLISVIILLSKLKISVYNQPSQMYN